MADILVTHSYFLHFDSKQWKAQRPYPPLATLYVASMLRSHGHSVDFYDTMFAASPDDIANAIRDEKPSYVIICDDGFNYLTKMCLTNMREAAFRMIEIAHAAGCKVIVSGSDATDHSADYLAHGADYIVVGEAEQTMLELMNELKSSAPDPSRINGLRFMKGTTMCETAKRENLREVDSLPFPAWDLVDMAAYRRRWLDSSGYFSINLVTTRGCPYKCNWCAKPIYGNRYNARSPENVVEELLMLKRDHGFDHVWFCDDIFGLKPGWVQRFAELVNEAGLVFSYKIQSRVDLLLEADTISALHESGCDEVWVGAESGSQKVLDAMDKGTTVQQIYEATRVMKTYGVKPCFFLQFGYPGEEESDIAATLRMLYELMPHDIGVSVSYPLPGTKFYDTVKSQLKEKSNWVDSDELAMMFRATFPPDFYRKLQRYVHREFRKRQAIRAWEQERNVGQALSLAFRIPQTFFSKAAVKKYVAGNLV